MAGQPQFRDNSVLDLGANVGTYLYNLVVQPKADATHFRYYGVYDQAPTSAANPNGSAPDTHWAFIIKMSNNDYLVYDKGGNFISGADYKIYSGTNPTTQFEANYRTNGVYSPSMQNTPADKIEYLFDFSSAASTQQRTERDNVSKLFYELKNSNGDLNALIPGSTTERIFSLLPYLTQAAALVTASAPMPAGANYERANNFVHHIGGNRFQPVQLTATLDSTNTPLIVNSIPIRIDRVGLAMGVLSGNLPLPSENVANPAITSSRADAANTIDEEIANRRASFIELTTYIFKDGNPPVGEALRYLEAYCMTDFGAEVVRVILENNQLAFENAWLVLQNSKVTVTFDGGFAGYLPFTINGSTNGTRAGGADIHLMNTPRNTMRNQRIWFLGIIHHEICHTKFGRADIKAPITNAAGTVIDPGDGPYPAPHMKMPDGIKPLAELSPPPDYQANFELIALDEWENEIRLMYGYRPREKYFHQPPNITGGHELLGCSKYFSDQTPGTGACIP